MAPNLKRTWAPRGETPILCQVTRSYRKVSAMGSIAISPKGRRRRVFFRLLENQNFTSDTCIAFVEQLKQNIKGQICLIWDRLRAHKSKKMESYLAKQTRVKVHYFPAYAPELNPVEYMWSYLKGTSMSNKVCFDINELFCAAKKNLCSIRKDADVVKSFVMHSPLSYVWRL
jgi:transposase